jgi:hypothetical protein
MTDAVHVTPDINAPSARGFDAWVKPDVIRGWLFKSPKNEIVHVDAEARVGSRFSILGCIRDWKIDHFGNITLSTGRTIWNSPWRCHGIFRTCLRSLWILRLPMKVVPSHCDSWGRSQNHPGQLAHYTGPTCLPDGENPAPGRGKSDNPRAFSPRY